MEDDSCSDDGLLSSEIPNRFFTECQNFLHGYDNCSVGQRQNDQDRRRIITHDPRGNQQDEEFESDRYRRHYRERKPHRHRRQAESYEHPRKHQHHHYGSSCSCTRFNDYNEGLRRHWCSQEKYNVLPEEESDTECHRGHIRRMKRRHEKQHEGNANFYNTFNDNEFTHKCDNRSSYNTKNCEPGEHPVARVDYRLSYNPPPHCSSDYHPDHPTRPQKIKPTLKRCSSTCGCNTSAYRSIPQHKSVDFVGLDGEIPYNIEMSLRKKSGVEERVQSVVNQSSFLMKHEMASQRKDPRSEVSRSPPFQGCVDPKPSCCRKHSHPFNPVTPPSLPSCHEMLPKSSQFTRKRISGVFKKLKRESKTNSECSLKQREPTYSLHKSKSQSSISGIAVKGSKCPNNNLMNQNSKSVYPTIYRVPKGNNITHSYIHSSSPSSERDKVISCPCDKVMGKCCNESSMNAVDQRYPEAFKEMYEVEDAELNYDEIASIDNCHLLWNSENSDRRMKPPTNIDLHDTKQRCKMYRKIERDGYESVPNLIIERVCYDPELRPITGLDFYNPAAMPISDWVCYDPVRKPIKERVFSEPVRKPIERICYESEPKPIQRVCCEKVPKTVIERVCYESLLDPQSLQKECYESVPKPIQRVCCEKVPKTVIERVCYESVLDPQSLQTECKVAPTSPTTVQASTINLCLKICVGTGNLLEPAKIMATLEPEKAKCPETLQCDKPCVVGVNEVPQSNNLCEETSPKSVCESAETSDDSLPILDDLKLVSIAPSLSDLERCENGKIVSKTFEDDKRINSACDSSVVQPPLPNQTDVSHIKFSQKTPPYKNEINEDYYEQLWGQRRKYQNASQQCSNRDSADWHHRDKPRLNGSKSDLAEKYQRSFHYDNFKADIVSEPKLCCRCPQEPKKPFIVPQPEFDYRPSFVEELKKELLESLRNKQQPAQLPCQCQCQCPKPQMMIYSCCPPASIIPRMCPCNVAPCPPNVGPYAVGSCPTLGPYTVGPCPANIVFGNTQSQNKFWAPL